MKLIHEQTEILPRGKHNKDFAIVFKTQREYDTFCVAFVELLKGEEEWTQAEIIWSGCEVEDLETDVYIHSTRDDIVERTADFKRLYKAAKAQSKR